MIQRLWAWVLHPPMTGPRATMVIRLMAGGVFFWEGILKFVYVNQGVGRFTKLGMPFPVFTASFVGGLEIVGGMMLMLGLSTRLITIPISGPGPWSLDASLLSGEEGKRDSLVGATARRPPLTGGRPPEAEKESWSDARRVVGR